MEQAEGLDEGEILREILHAVRDTPEGVYHPGEDSFLMLDAISGLPFEGKQVLDLGTGSGILGLYCSLRGARVTLADIEESAVRHAVKAARLLRVECKAIVSDLFSKISDQFDFVLFNPPYLRSARIMDSAVDGGPAGRTIIERFLRELPHHLGKGGTAFLLISSLNEPASLVRQHPEFYFSTVTTRPLFFEELQVLSLRLRETFPS